MDDLFGFQGKELYFYSVQSIREYSNEVDNQNYENFISLFIRLDS